MTSQREKSEFVTEGILAELRKRAMLIDSAAALTQCHSEEGAGLHALHEHLLGEAASARCHSKEGVRLHALLLLLGGEAALARCQSKEGAFHPT